MLTKKSAVGGAEMAVKLASPRSDNLSGQPHARTFHWFVVVSLSPVVGTTIEIVFAETSTQAPNLCGNKLD